MDTVAAPQGPAGRPVQAADGAAVGAAIGVAVALVGHVGRSPWDVFIGVVLAGLSLALVDGVITLLRAVLRRILHRPLPAVSAWLGRARTIRLSFPLTGLILVLGPWIGPTTVLRIVHAGAAGSIVVVVATVTGGAIGWARGQASGGARGARVAAAGVLLLAAATLAWLVAPGPGAGIVAPPDPAPVPPLAVADPSLRGPETVRRATYGSGLDPHRAAFGDDADWGTEPIDASRDLVLDPLLSTHVRLATGARTEALPVNGTVWYPQGARDAPLVLIVHGNHGLSRASDRGYAALADHLASRGAVVVSVDQNFLNGSFVGDSDGREQPVRARMLLEHLRGWERWAGEDGPMDGVVDLDRVAIIGHSRGGEAAAHAAGILQRPETAPAGWTLPDRVRVRAVVAIEPTDGPVGTRRRSTTTRRRQLPAARRGARWRPERLSRHGPVPPSRPRDEGRGGLRRRGVRSRRGTVGRRYAAVRGRSPTSSAPITASSTPCGAATTPDGSTR
jgi:dienelactone hydrolase